MATQSSLPIDSTSTALKQRLGDLLSSLKSRLFELTSASSTQSSSSPTYFNSLAENSAKTGSSMFYPPLLKAAAKIESTGGGNGSSSAIARPFLLSKQFFTDNQKQILSIVGKLLGLSLSALTTYFLLKWLLQRLDPTNEEKLLAKIRADRILKQIGVSNIELNEYEMVIASNIIMPQNIDCSWNDIGGLEHLIDDLRETVIYPLKDFDAYYSQSSDTMNSVLNRRSKLIQPPKGVLLFGPPGNAKTMIAKALAKESGARFINLQVSTLFDKWFGESQKRTEAIFTLANKIQPVIIFIDEIDSFLRARRGDDHECTATMKTQFMTLWDGLTTSQRQNRILIIGATNRPEDVDGAILRRMPQMFYIGLPDKIQRRKILNVILKDEILADDVDLDEIAEKTGNFSGSDIHELCRNAAMNSFIETVRSIRSGGDGGVNSSNNDPDLDQDDSSSTTQRTNTPEPTNNCIRAVDFDVAFQKMATKTFVTGSRNRFDFASRAGAF